MLRLIIQRKDLAQEPLQIGILIDSEVMKFLKYKWLGRALAGRLLHRKLRIVEAE